MGSDAPFPPLTLGGLSAALDAGSTTSQAIVDACLGAIAMRDAALHAFVEVWADDARRAARAAGLEREAGFVRGPLHGLPIALKDLFDVAGRVTTAGSASRAGARASGTASCVRRLLDAGMIPLGKTHMVEFAFGTFGTNRSMGAPRNPWDPVTHRVAGGSSSGSAVAVAAGLAPAALGSDTGGSVRIPAAACGLTGLKPTYGRVSLAGVVPLSPTLDSIGPITRTVEDAAMLLAAMSGPDPDDPTTRGIEAFDAVAALAAPVGLRGLALTALAVDALPDGVAGDVVAAYVDAIHALREAGARVEEAAVPIDWTTMGARNGRLIAIEGYALHRATIDDERHGVDAGVRARMLSARSATAVDYLDALAERRRAVATFRDWMRGRDALLTPMLPIVAPALDAVDETTTPLATFSRALNYVGGCALALPSGSSAERMPVGVQVIGAPWREDVLVRVGRAYQHATDWHRRLPPAP